MSPSFHGPLVGPPGLVAATAMAQERLEQQALSLAPRLGARLTAWMRRLAPEGRAEAYFLHPEAFPSLLLAWLFEEAIAGKPAGQEARELVYSSMSGYYAIRLIDNVMDGDAVDEIGLLPATAFLHLQFERHYHKYFDVGHVFWRQFDADWTGAAEAAIEDAALTEIDRNQFEAVSARKVLAGRIPMASVAQRLLGGPVPADWEQIFSLLSRFHQMRNDLFDWQRDDVRGASTYFLNQARQRLQPQELVSGWLAREGFDWGSGLLIEWLEEALEIADRMHAPDLTAYLARRRRDLAAAIETVKPGLAILAALATQA